MTSPDALDDLRPIDPTDLVDTRIQLHYAAQLVAAVGRSVAPRQPGFRHAALYWEHWVDGLVGGSIGMPATGATVPRRAELRFAGPSIAFAAPARDAVTAADAQKNLIALAGLTFEQAWQGLRERIAAAGYPAADLVLKLPRDLPAHPLREGVPFAVDADRAAALAGWFGLASRVLAEAAGRHGIPGPVPCWGDHFDLAVVVPVGPGATVTLGFSPGDAAIPQPYLYVLPWPVPDRAGLPGLPAGGGGWQTHGWVGLVLPATDIESAADPRAAARSFLERGFQLASAIVVAA